MTDHDLLILQAVNYLGVADGKNHADIRATLPGVRGVTAAAVRRLAADGYLEAFVNRWSNTSYRLSVAGEAIVGLAGPTMAQVKTLTSDEEEARLRTELRTQRGC